MPCVPIRLEATGLDPLDLSSGAFVMKALDTGYPVVREVADDLPDADGSIDTSSLAGARTVTLGVSISPAAAAESRWTLTQRLKAFMNPRLRPRLYVQYGSADPELVLTLRPSNFEDRLQRLRTERFDVVAQWVCPSGILESAAQNEETIIPGAGSTAGIEFGPTLDEFDGVEFPLVDPPGTVEITNAGDRDAYPIIRLFGPFGDEGTSSDETTIENLTSGKSLVFAGMGISAGDYVEIDFRAKTILLNGTTSKYSYLLFPDSSWWTLRPGVNEIAFRPDTFSGNANAVVFWRDAYS